MGEQDAVQIMSKTQFRDYQWLVGKTVQEVSPNSQRNVSTTSSFF